MPHTKRIHEMVAIHIRCSGLHTGPQFAAPGPRPCLDLCAAYYLVAEGGPVPLEFYSDETASIRLIECSAGAMQAIRSLSAALDTEPPVTTIAPGVDVPDYIEHVSHWAATPAIGEQRPPTESEVIGRILRATRAEPSLLAYLPTQRHAA
ncbi:hypothetical protein [Streptomyces lavendofoliae]|uniref:Uncharacterized protein n=1 Tax=Streptomyces lavendofoliae TaxID=67314 RepID=A0A918I2H1_9ACTN|nr:hypothetical protein [Streptomyces lavendofoliae]GGU62070.1 hypothetical protein GCM10010274_58550 [Streptomyces lavendofoliae]